MRSQTSSGTQVQPQIILDTHHLPDSLSIFYEYGSNDILQSRVETNRTSNNSVQSNTFFFDNRKMARACDDECCEFRVIHQIKFQRLIRGHHVFQNVWSLYKVETLTAQSDNRDEAQENDKYAVTRKTIIDQKNWLALNRLSFQSYCIILFKQVLEIISTLK